ncbi:MAG: PQQ-binding-like beta-propeller repeat protein [Oscillospiraceae bacterium]|nr:PQQ-binding-like beta-propeller repeat protein [Oscillospiraceae bacterium]
MKYLLAFAVLILILLLVFFVSVTSLRLFNTVQHFERLRKRSGRKENIYIKLFKDKLLVLLSVVTIAVLAGLILSVNKFKELTPVKTAAPEASQTEQEAEKEVHTVEYQTPEFAPAKTDKTDPAKWYIDWKIIAGGEVAESYAREEKISFGEPEEYFALPGISTFRGDNYRSGGTYGTAQVTDKKITEAWSVETGSLTAADGENQLGGAGWTGQALAAKWDSETRGIMNMYDTVGDGAVEIIYAAMDGKIYFLNMEDGSYTRDPIAVGMAFKGSGSLDPRGYPLLYVGSGDVTAEGKRPRMYIISLIDGSVLWEYGDSDDYSLRRDNDGWTAFDSCPLVDGETDTLIWPGENGLLYTVKLNTVYDKAAGTISVEPEDTVKTRYAAGRSGNNEYWLGYEMSAAAIGGYLYLSENGGLFYCVDLNTMELVWTQDTGDDSNSSPVAEFDPVTSKGSVYTASSLHWGADENSEGEVSIFKLNAANGEILWQRSYPCHTVEGISGGVLATPLLGKKGTNMEKLIIYPVARTPDIYDGILVALDTKTGDEVWKLDMESYTWSSPAAVYTDDGRGYIVLCDSVGQVCLIDGATGEVLNEINVGSMVDASPVIIGDTAVVGTKGRKIFGLKIS